MVPEQKVTDAFAKGFYGWLGIALAIVVYMILFDHGVCDAGQIKVTQNGFFWACVPEGIKFVPPTPSGRAEGWVAVFLSVAAAFSFLFADTLIQK